MLDEQGLKTLSVLKDDPGFAKINWFSYFRLKTSLDMFSNRKDLTLRSTGVTLPSVKMGKTPLDHALLTSTAVTLPSVKTGKTPLDHTSLTSKVFTLHSEKTGKTPLDYVPCISEAFKRITKGSSYYR